jgi:hypothetical protein
MGSRRKKERNNPVGKGTKGDRLLWSDLYYILLQNRWAKVKRFFPPVDASEVGRRAFEGGGRGPSINRKQLDRATPAGYPLQSEGFVYLFVEMLV